MRISLIAALNRRGLIGDAHGLPWNLPADLRRFRKYTLGKPLIMGRGTFASIGRPLPGRFNIVLSHNAEYHPPGCGIARSFPKALALAEEYLATHPEGGDEVMVIGGGKVYAEALPHADRLYLTVVEGQFTGDTYFPVQALQQQRWRALVEPEVHCADDLNPHPHTFLILERIREADPSPLTKGEPCAEFDLALLLTCGVLP